MFLDKKKKARPIVATPAMQDPVRRKINNFFAATIFLPILQKIKETHKIYFNNISSPLQDALLSGRVQYAKRIFKGNFSAAISKQLISIGAKWDKRILAFRLEINKLPVAIQSAIAQATLNFETLNLAVVKEIDKIYGQIDSKIEKLDFTFQYESAIENIDKQFTRTIGSKLGITADLMPSDKKRIAEEYSDNLKTYVKIFTQEQTKKMREEVEENFFTGYRADRLEKIIKDRYGISRRKAHFLARQETNLLTAKYREIRYADGGVTKYEWSTTPHGGSGVRPDHQELNGKIFSFDDPPIVDKANGRKANPGEDYNCYCKALPIFD